MRLEVSTLNLVEVKKLKTVLFSLKICQAIGIFVLYSCQLVNSAFFLSSSCK